MNRPKIHFAPLKNWMNDPNGTVFDGEKYHLFYQYNPSGSDWGNIRWAYATSENLLDWTRKGVRLAPDASIGERYCFSGCATKHKDGFKIFYTSIGFEEDAARLHAKQLICNADAVFSRIDRTGTGLFADIHPFRVTEWRDPFVFVFDGVHYLVTAAVTDRARILLYRATDDTLERWAYDGVLFTPECGDDIAECPNVAVFGEKIVLLYSLCRTNVVRYATGDFDGKNFAVTNEGTADFGINCFYASNLAVGRGGEVILFGWQKESLIGSSSVDGTYSGCLALPRVMRLTGGKVGSEFIDGIKKLHKATLPVAVENGKSVCRASAELVHIAFTAEKGAAAEIFANDRERVLLEFGEKNLSIRRESLTENADERTLQMPSNEINSVEIIGDGTIAEMLVNGSAVSFRFYRRDPMTTLFEQLKGRIADISVTELNAPEIKDE